MSFIRTIPLNEASGDTLAMYQRQQAPYGFVPNYAKVWCYRPELMQAWADLQRAIKKRVEFKTYELATFAAAVGLGNSGCSLAHAKVLMRECYSADDIADIVVNDGEHVLTEKEQALVKFAKLVVGNASAITEADVDRLRAAGCGEAEIFDVAIVAAARCFFAKIHDALGVLLDSTALDCDTTLLDLLVVGRPVSAAPVERLSG